MKIKSVRAKLADKKCLYCEHFDLNVYIERVNIIGKRTITAFCKEQNFYTGKTGFCSAFEWRKNDNG